MVTKKYKYWQSTYFMATCKEQQNCRNVLRKSILIMPLIKWRIAGRPIGLCVHSKYTAASWVTGWKKRGKKLQFSDRYANFRQNSDTLQLSNRGDYACANFNFALSFPKNGGFKLQNLHFWTKIFSSRRFSVTRKFGEAILLPLTAFMRWRHC